MLITRCPECATAFRCYREQLDQARGWVRCGRCSAVFEAEQHVWTPSMSPTNGPLPREPSLDAWADLSTTLDADHRVPANRVQALSARPARWTLTAAMLCLALLLPAQWLMGQRDQMAAQSPLWRGVWSEGCHWLGCELGWPRQPQALRIESIHFEPDATGRYDVALQIRNAATHPVASPWVELSLLGLRDEVLLRRALSPQDLGLDGPVLALREAAAGLRFQLPDDLAPAVTGYKAILFYP